MNTVRKNLIGVLWVGLIVQAVAQNPQAEPGAFDQKLRLGISLNQYWGTIRGSSLPEDYFAKPCIGFNIRGEYYFLPFAGVGLGWGLQQRGAGIINPDLSGGSFTHPWELPQFDPDSTYRERLRINGWEVPITLLLRTPRDVIKGVRLSGALGLCFVKTTSVHNFFLSVEDGYHEDRIVTDDYEAADLALQTSLGADIDAGGAGVLQFHLVYTRGTKNVFRDATDNGNLITYGFRLSWLYQTKKN